MRRKGIHRPTVEDIVEISGIETLHPGGIALTRRTGEVAGLAPDMKILDVSSGRGTQAVFYARTFGVEVTGVDLSEEMLAAARGKAQAAGLSDRVRFKKGDSQALPFENATFDSAVNECAVGIPEDSQAVLNEMGRVVKPGESVVIHESTWKAKLSLEEKDEFSERYGTTPLELEEWREMLWKAGVVDIEWEFEQWSRPEMFWKIRNDRDVPHPSKVFTLPERLRTMFRVMRKYGIHGVRKANENAAYFFRGISKGKLGYCLYWGRRG